MCEESKQKWMGEALAEAKLAAAEGEVPIGAVIVYEGKAVGFGRNSVKADKDPTSHAEMNAIRDASKRLGRERLTGCDMYVTCEPCAMCAGALVLARVERLFIGAMDPKAGACGSLRNIANDERLNHRITVETGIREDECAALLKDFFKALRRG